MCPSLSPATPQLCDQNAQKYIIFLPTSLVSVRVLSEQYHTDALMWFNTSWLAIHSTTR